MSVQDMTPADFAAVNGNGGFGGEGWWIILLFIILGGWGNRGYNGTGGAGDVGGNELYPWMEMQQQNANLSQQFMNCCCENRIATANLAATVASEACADRAAVSDGIRDVLANQNANVQRILDQMCQDKIDSKNDEIAQLRTQINIMNLAASQNAQTAAIIANNEAQTIALERYLAPTPMPAYVVQNPNCCQQWQGCGCGM